jgi:hypothetical protein
MANSIDRKLPGSSRHGVLFVAPPAEGYSVNELFVYEWIEPSKRINSATLNFVNPKYLVSVPNG